MKIEFPESPPGIHPPTAALNRILTFEGISNPLNHQPYTEAFLLGLGGGLGAGYILFQFSHLPHPMLLLGFRNRWNNTKAFLRNLSSRLDLIVRFQEFESSKAAEEALQEAIKQGQLALVWVDKALLPYHHIPERLRGYINHQVAVYGRDGRLWRLYLDDLSSQPIEIREKTFTAARANLSQNNFLMMVYKGARPMTAQTLREEITKGIQDCTTQLTHPLKTIGVSTLETWAQKLTDHRDRQGWPQIFKEQRGLFPVLRRIYELIKLDGTEGFALRKLYSDFLHEAAGYLNNPRLNAVAGQYLQLSNHWANLAENALPSKVAAFDQMKNLLNKKYDAYRQYDLESYKKTIKDMRALEIKLTADFPLKGNDVSQLFERLSSQVKLISELEGSAALHLRDVIRQ